MKTLLVYYSHYGHTYNVALSLQEALGKLGTVDTCELEYLMPRQGLLKRAFYRLFPDMVKLAPVPLDLKNYEILCLGVPVWGGKPSAPVTKYLHLCKNLENKIVVCFFVYSIEASAKACFNFVQKLLKTKGSRTVVAVYVPWDKTQNKDFLDKTIGPALEKISPPPQH